MLRFLVAPAKFALNLCHRLFRIITFPFRVLIALGSTILAVTTVIFFLLSLSLPILTTLSAGAYQMASWAAEQVTSVPDVLKRQSHKAEIKLAEKETALVTERAAASEARQLSNKAAAQLDAMAARTATLEAKLAAKAETRVIYRSEKRLLSEVVADASARVAGRLRTMLAADISSMAGQVVPYVGAAVVVSSIGYDAYQSCEMIKELHDLDVAFNPDHAIEVNEVCGMHVPTMAELGNSTWNTTVWLGDKIEFWN